MQPKPIYLNLFQFAFPITAIVSILHRISGVIIFFLIPIFLIFLQMALYYPWLQLTSGKVIIWLGLTAVIYHLFAGIRHLCMDAGLGESKQYARISSYVVFILTILSSIFVGFRLC